jgi:hypothetical protein
MSTRANIIIVDGHDELIFYRHSDGYPKGTVPTLTEFLQLVKSRQIRDNVSQAAGWLVLVGAREYGVKLGNAGIEYASDSCCAHPGMQWKVGAYEPTTGIHGDIEYLYVVDLRVKKIRHQKIDWDEHCNAVVPREFYSGRFNSTREAE